MAKKGHRWTEEQKEARRGIVRSEETRRRMSESKKGKPRSDDAKQKISQGKLRYTFTEKHLQHVKEGNQPSIPKTCLQCGKDYIGKKRQKYCCASCGQRYRKANAAKKGE
jgi:hypothetical protein